MEINDRYRELVNKARKRIPKSGVVHLPSPLEYELLVNQFHLPKKPFTCNPSQHSTWKYLLCRQINSNNIRSSITVKSCVSDDSAELIFKCTITFLLKETANPNPVYLVKLSEAALNLANQELQLLTANAEYLSTFFITLPNKFYVRNQWKKAIERFKKEYGIF